MKNIFFLHIFIILICCITFSYAQYDFSKIDRHADNAPDRLKRSIPALVDYLAGPAKSDLEKVRAIFRWITQNINYDIEAYLDHRLIVDDPQRVIARSMAVCGGYSQLFNSMCSEAGIQSKLISGWSKGYGERLTGRPNHAWNAVKINFRWYLLDATWGAGHINSEQRFIREFNNHYFLTDPEQLIYDHLPEDNSWQLIKNPISRKQFDSLVLLRPAFFKNGLKLKTHFTSRIISDGELNIEIEAPDNSYISVRQLKNNILLPGHYAFTQRDAGVYIIHARFPEIGSYTLRLFTKIGQKTEQYNWACDYEVNVIKALNKDSFFVKQYGKFFDLDVFVHQPIDFSLPAGELQYFKIELKNALEVAVISGEDFFPLKKINNTFADTVVVPPGLFHLSAKIDTSNSYHWLLEYEGK